MIWIAYAIHARVQRGASFHLLMSHQVAGQPPGSLTAGVDFRIEHPNQPPFPIAHVLSASSSEVVLELPAFRSGG